MNTGKCLLALLMAAVVTPASLSANDTLPGAESMVAYSQKNNHSGKSSSRNSKNYQPVDCWTPYFTWMGNVQNQETKMFTQFNVGIGFLYFSHVRGVATVASGNLGRQSLLTSKDVAFGDIQYNRTPVFEYVLGNRMFNWFSYAVSYQHQDGVNIRTAPVPVATSGTAATGSALELRGTLALDAVELKLNFELPYPMILKSWAYSPYLAVAGGPSWISFTDVSCAASGSFLNAYGYQPLRAKYSANMAWMLDLGIHIQPADPSTGVSFNAGCKYTEYGQLRSVGKQSQIGGNARANENYLQHPFRVRTVYSFAPYVGAQWNF